MPIPTAPTLLLAVGTMSLILSRSLQTSRWYEGIWLAAIVGAGWFLVTGDQLSTAVTSDLRSVVWSTDSLSLAGQSLGLMVGALFGLGCFGIRSGSDRTAARFGFLSFLTAGVMLASAANDLITMALSFEIVQFACWSLRKVDHLEGTDVPLDRTSGEGIRSQDKINQWLGITTSCCLWLGIALLANLVATTQFDQIRMVLTDAYVVDSGRAVIGAGSKWGLLAIGMIVAGLGSRMGLVPWQIGFIESSRHVSYWTAGCVLLGGQLTGILALARLCGTVWVGYRDELLVLLMVLSGLTCVVAGALAGLGLMSGEGRLRRWMTSIPMLHGAWMTVGLMAATADLATPEQSLSVANGQPGSLALLLFAVTASQLGLAGFFLILSFLCRENRDVEFIDELMGLFRLCPAPAVALIVVLASLIGQPPLWGFWSNWLLLVAGLNVRASAGPEDVIPHSGMLIVLIVASMATLFTAAVVVRFARIVLLERPISHAQPHGRRSALIMGCVCALALVVVGLAPARLLSLFSHVRGPNIKSAPADPTGSSRNSATVQM